MTFRDDLDFIFKPRPEVPRTAGNETSTGLAFCCGATLPASLTYHSDVCPVGFDSGTNHRETQICKILFHQSLPFTPSLNFAMFEQTSEFYHLVRSR